MPQLCEVQEKGVIVSEMYHLQYGSFIRRDLENCAPKWQWLFKGGKSSLKTCGKVSEMKV